MCSVIRMSIRKRERSEVDVRSTSLVRMLTELSNMNGGDSIMSISRIIARLRNEYRKDVNRDVDLDELNRFHEFCKSRNLIFGEPFFVPEEWFYEPVLKLLRPDDVVFDVGAGDLRFDLLASRIVRKIYAIEVNPSTIGKALTIIKYDLPKNVIPICADAWDIPLPKDVTTITC